MGWSTGWGMGGWVVMGLAMVIFWGAVAFGLVVLLRPSRRPGEQQGDGSTSRHHPRGSAMQTLDEWFARGDVTEEEYRQRRDLLMGS